MRTIVHLSDFHFGRIDPSVLPPLVETVRQIAPDLIAVSGDLTQRARRSQFAGARAFLQQLAFPQIIVPGNHDVPLYNLPARFLAPLSAFQRHIDANLEPVYLDEEIIAVGLNSARAALYGRGRLNEGQVARAAARLQSAPAGMVKIVVTHHPFDLPEGHSEEQLVGRSRMAMEYFARAGANLLLAGHLHVSHVGQTAERYKIAGYSALVVQAGTLSTRGRGEPNSFNVVRIARPAITVERFALDRSGQEFVKAWTGNFQHSPAGWISRD